MCDPPRGRSYIIYIIYLESLREKLFKLIQIDQIFVRFVRFLPCKGHSIIYRESPDAEIATFNVS